MSDAGKIASRWWYALNNKDHPDRATLARLRRCEDAADAAAVVAALKLTRDLQCQDARTNEEDALELAVLLAHVKEDDGQRLMRAAGWKSFPGDKKETEAAAGDRPVLSELRFRRLLKTAREDRLEAFKRLVRILGGKVNVADLAENYIYWGDKVRERWAFDYYAASAPQPANEIPEGGAVS